MPACFSTRCASYHTGTLNVDAAFVAVYTSALYNESLINKIAELARRGGTPHPLVYDKVVRCLGWKHGMDMYTEKTSPTMQHNGKYAVMTGEYESINVPGLYFAGTLGHGKDHQRSAGGFIHGFRYTTRALFRVLEEKYQNTEWPGPKFSNVEKWLGKDVGIVEHGCNAADWGLASAPCVPPPAVPEQTQEPFVQLIDKLFSRINSASGPYQMVGVLGDGVVLECPRVRKSATTAPTPAQIQATYKEEIPAEHFNAKFDRYPRFFWQFGYAEQARSLHKSRTGGTLFQIHIYWYPGDCTGQQNPPMRNGVRMKEVIRIYEDLHTNWNTW